ncbi:NYN domain-containing protein [uncultured Litoreibacter sp.]|uniref:NYN domain-containing protein n=1 Tax=uncultured Litoreibacter sp. TaxID=1392394 RepID=UPI002630AC3F|nr:NYN domain-containing protein [uncultured Litoreibacter sp.]
MRDVIVYVDGFNLYHALDELGDDSLKWLCLRRLSEGLIGPRERLKQVKYFSAYATWIPGAYGRHRAYVSALGAEGVKFIPGKFKKKYLKCKKCRAPYQTYEEKETDVNIAIHLIRDTFEDSFDRAIVISADTDMRPAIEMARNINGTKSIDIVTPPKRFSRARSLNPLLQISTGKIRAARLNDHYELEGGKSVTIPENYKPVSS